mmetsp:Transcript_16620/g.16823  ORF Transcript_16620/g.16823 Transcript_16620/m.16823 type:complete len:228 (+) Transcript_16620:396-1079(+)
MLHNFFSSLHSFSFFPVMHIVIVIIVIIVVVIVVIRMLFATLLPFFPTSFTFALLAAWFVNIRWLGWGSSRRFGILVVAIRVTPFPTNPTSCWRPSTQSTFTAAAMTCLFIIWIVAGPTFFRTCFMHFYGAFICGFRRFWIIFLVFLIATIGVAFFPANPISCWRPSADSTFTTITMTSLLVVRIIADPTFIRTSLVHFYRTIFLFTGKLSNFPIKVFYNLFASGRR